jgi:hypothetical protein
LENGTVVHNSKDIADAIAGSFYTCFKNMVPSGNKSQQAAFVDKVLENRKKEGRSPDANRYSIYSKLV